MKNRRCLNLACPLRGKVSSGNIVRHGFYRTRSGKRRRYRCGQCGKTFSSTKGTPYYRLQHRRATFDGVIALRVEGVSILTIPRQLLQPDLAPLNARQHQHDRIRTQTRENQPNCIANPSTEAKQGQSLIRRGGGGRDFFRIVHKKMSRYHKSPEALGGHWRLLAYSPPRILPR